MTCRGSFSFLFWGFCLIAIFYLDHTNSLRTKPKGSKHLTSVVSKDRVNRVKLNSNSTSSNSSTNGDPNTIVSMQLSSRILQINDASEVTVVSKPINSDIIVGKDVAQSAKIILECSAPFPVQWIYSGDGMPEISTNTSMTKSLKSAKSWDHFTATASMGFNRNLQESDTGEYICRSVQNSIESLHYYIYVPGESLFTGSKTTSTIKIRESQKFMRIPCSVTDPDTLVTLQKKVNGFLQCPVESSIFFSPKSGFTVNFSSADGFQDDPSGKYICIAASTNGSFQIKEFSVQRIIVSGPETFLSENKHFADGYDDSVELEDIHARNEGPCYPNNPCGSNSHCSQIPGKNLPRCTCLPAYIGRPPNCRPECILNLDCSPDMTCRNQHCEDPCLEFCGEGAICQVENHMPSCSCPPGHIGNPSKSGKCWKTRSPSEHYFPTRPVFPTEPHQIDSSDPDFLQYNRFSCEPWPCGPFSECRPVGNNAHCTCAPGYIGHPPNCRPECRRNSDCSGNFACVESKCRDPCSFRNIKCGNQAKCMTINHQPDCFCPTGFRGDPMINCNKQQGNSQKPINGPFPESPSSSSEESSENYQPNQMRPGYPGSGSSSGGFRPQPPQIVQAENSPCKKSPCGKNALCNFRNQTIGCKCPMGFTGFGSDPLQECYPSNNPCEICGPNSECHVRKNRQPVCSCLPGKIGNPPNCRDNFCEKNLDCPQTQRCHRGRCENPCERAKCGQNAVCRGMNHLPVCACPNAPSKDPLNGCPPRNNGEYNI